MIWCRRRSHDQGHAAGYPTDKREAWRTYFEQHTALAVLGALSNQSVLDLDCGESPHSHLLKQLGAAR